MDDRHVDPPGMPEDERMEPAEFRVVREYLGLSQEWLAGHLGVSRRTIASWEKGQWPIPDGVRLEMEALESVTADNVSFAIDQLMDLPEPTLLTFRTDEQLTAAHPDLGFPASWHRMLAARVAQEVPALRIVFPPDGDGEGR